VKLFSEKKNLMKCLKILFNLHFKIKFGLKIFFYLNFRRDYSGCPFNNFADFSMNLAAQIIKRAAQKNNLAVHNK
jgi:hypothetical protein